MTNLSSQIMSYCCSVWFLPKHSWTKKIAFRNKYYGELKQKLSFLDLIMYRRFSAKKFGFPTKEHSADIKTWWQFDYVLGCFISRGNGLSISIRGIMKSVNKHKNLKIFLNLKSKDYIKILDKNLQLSAQNHDLVQGFISGKIMIPNIHLNQWLHEKDFTSAMAFNESWLESYWKYMTRIKVQINHLSPKNLQELKHVTIEEWKKIPEKTCSNFMKNLRKQLQVIKMRGHTNDYWYCENCSVFYTVWIILSFPFLFIFLLTFCKFNPSFSKLSFIFSFLFT